MEDLTELPNGLGGLLSGPVNRVYMSFACHPNSRTPCQIVFCNIILNIIHHTTIAKMENLKLIELMKEDNNMLAPLQLTLNIVKKVLF